MFLLFPVPMDFCWGMNCKFGGLYFSKIRAEGKSMTRWKSHDLGLSPPWKKESGDVRIAFQKAMQVWFDRNDSSSFEWQLLWIQRGNQVRGVVLA